MTTRKKKQPSDETPSSNDVSFEQALERLEAIVGEMEDGDLDLETMISRFEEGRRHLKFCTAKLNDVERRIEMLVKKDDAMTLEPFDETVGTDDRQTKSGREKDAGTMPSPDDGGELPF